MALTILFWNTHRNPVAEAIAALVAEHDVDVLCLAESTIPDAALLAHLNPCSDRPFARVPVSQCRQLATYYRPSRVGVETVLEGDRHVAISAVPVCSQEILVVLAHLPMQLYSDPAKLVRNAELLSIEIADAEAKCGHTRTLLIGDLNIDPFHDGLILPWALNATPSRRVASRECRTVDGRPYPFFYNPMWNLFGDDTTSPPGSYYFNADQGSIYWHMVDQALVRPQLLADWHIETLTIPTCAGTISLVTPQGRPKANSISDHLPLLLGLREGAETEGRRQHAT